MKLLESHDANENALWIEQVSGLPEFWTQYQHMKDCEMTAKRLNII